MFLNYFKGRSQNEKNCCILTPSFLHTFSVCLPEKLPRWKDLAADLEKKIENKSHELNMSQIKWMSWVSSDYLTSCGLYLQSVCKNDGCNGNSLLHKLAIITDPKPLRLLISKFIEVNQRNDIGETPLHLACLHGNKQSAKILLSNFAEINARDLSGNTPMMHLASRKIPDVDFIRFLLSERADLKMENLNQQKAWDIAKSVKSKQKIVDILNPYLFVPFI